MNKLTINELSSAIAEERVLILPCKIGDPVYLMDMMPCVDCGYNKGKAYENGYKDKYGNPVVDDCDEDCPKVAMPHPFNIYMLDDNLELRKPYKLNPEDVVSE